MATITTPESLQTTPHADHVLFQPLKLGRVQLRHRIAMAPLTRFRADEQHVHGDLAVEYYSQRASVPGTLLITEGTFISPGAGGFDNVPGIYTTEQITAWKRVTDAVHAKGCFIFLQLWALGRSAKLEVLKREGNFPYISSSSKRLTGFTDEPRPLTIPEIQQWVKDYAQAARNAIAAGFDGVEIHGANGFLIDQFIQDVVNERSDAYGGSIETRSRFALEVVHAVVDAIGQDRTGLRLSPWNTFQGMGMADPIPQFAHLIQSIRNKFPQFAYIHVVEPPIVDDVRLPGTNDAFRKIWTPLPFLSANEYTPESALTVSETKGDVIVFGRYFISNPDLPRRIKEGIPLIPYNTKTFYLARSPEGYIDYPFADEQFEREVDEIALQPRL